MSSPKVVASYHQTMTNIYLFNDGVLRQWDEEFDHIQGRSFPTDRDDLPLENREEFVKAIVNKGPVVAQNGSVMIYDLEAADELKEEWGSLLDPNWQL